MNVRYILCLMLSLLTLVMFGCGGNGGGEGGSATAVVKVATSGALPTGTSIGGISATVLATPSTGLTLAADAVAVSGAGAGSTLIPNVNAVAAVSLGLINANGIQTGEFSALGYHAAAGVTPTAATFSIAEGAEIVDVHGAAIPGITVVIQSVTIQ